MSSDGPRLPDRLPPGAELLRHAWLCPNCSKVYTNAHLNCILLDGEPHSSPLSFVCECGTRLEIEFDSVALFFGGLAKVEV